VLYQCGFFFGARSIRFGSDSCDTRLPMVVVGLLRFGSHKPWSCGSLLFGAWPAHAGELSP
jgi:hypothetical protein